MTLRLKVTPAGRAGAGRMAIVGTGGRELLHADFTDPRQKGATIRSLRAKLGDQLEVEDTTLTGRRSPSG